MTAIIYKMTILDGVTIYGEKPFYVGQHIGNDLKNYDGSGIIWVKCIKKLKKQFPKNWEDFILKEILFKGDVSLDTINVLEKVFIKRCKSLYELKLGGCNIAEGGRNACISKSEIARKKISVALSGEKNPMFGKKLSKEAREKISEKNKGRKLTESQRLEIKKWRTGIKLSDETREKLRLANSGENNPNWGKRGIETSMFGRHQTEYQKSVMSKRMSGKNNPMYGRTSPNKGVKMSEEQKRKISESHKKRYELKKQQENI